ncbi:uncharacterized protein I206_105547 [Kwoniella pini CBS 10737]|uniref:Major facilitator superfamily (MFS) profile domain-containing protein n=1 Tax=Kwoniella pini CBS 10737 TaxID=1296096 RepID=A0A1B9I415_9TREE|nr:uncharacterized protein I206_03550 [Kwoniella pini CBS 10737]OCF50231.1 hypothetical protein I206_03550 [Kwoniella pini CBS 10737]
MLRLQGEVSRNPFQGMRRHSRSYMLALVCYWGAMLFGYDTGVAGSTIALPGFIKDFHLEGNPTHVSNLKSNVVSVLQAGCFFGALSAAPISQRFGRKYTLMAFAGIFFVGAVVQTVAKHNLTPIYVGRVLAGIGVGAMSAVAPPYVSENAPKELRGRITGLFQFILASGVMISYWIPYGVSVHIPSSTLQWRIPIAIQMVPAGCMVICLLFVKESPRWLAFVGKDEQALQNLAWLRKTSTDHPETLQEFAEIKTGLEDEKNSTSSNPYRELLKKGQWPRLLIAVSMMFLTQWSGQNAIGYYAPSIFQSIGFEGATPSLLASGVYGIVKFVATGVFLMVGIEQFGRRKSLMFGAFFMGMFFFIIGSILYTHPVKQGLTTIPTSSIAAAVMIYLYVIPYCFSWGPIAWVYVSEIFPTGTRATGVSLAAATQWLWNFVLAKITPFLTERLTNGRLFFMFGSINMLMATYSYFIPETRGLSLEDMDVLFGAITPEQRKANLEARERGQFDNVNQADNFGEEEKEKGEIAHVETVQNFKV